MWRICGASICFLIGYLLGSVRTQRAAPVVANSQPIEAIRSSALRTPSPQDHETPSHRCAGAEGEAGDAGQRRREKMMRPPDAGTPASSSSGFTHWCQELFESSKYALGWGCGDCQARAQKILIRWAMYATAWCARRTGYGGLWLDELSSFVGMPRYGNDDNDLQHNDSIQNRPQRSSETSSRKLSIGGCLRGVYKIARRAWDCKQCRGRVKRMVPKLGLGSIRFLARRRGVGGMLLDVLFKLLR